MDKRQTYIVLPEGAVIKDMQMLPSAPPQPQTTKMPTEIIFDGSNVKANVANLDGGNNGFHFPPTKNVVSPVVNLMRTPLPVIGGKFIHINVLL